MLRVVIIGSGNVAQHLARVFSKSEDSKLVQAFARKPQNLLHVLSAEQVTDNVNDLVEADVYIIAVSDDAIAEVSSLLPFSGRLVVHTSGSVHLDAADNRNRRGVFYPLQTFSKKKQVDFHVVPICLESENAADYKVLEQLARTISGIVYPVSSAQRQALHVAAVFVSNFVNHMYDLGGEICNDNAIPFDILKPLIKETADKIQEMPPREAQTGPAVRNDIKTIARHVNFIKDNNLKELYTLLTQSIQSKNGEKL